MRLSQFPVWFQLACVVVMLIGLVGFAVNLTIVRDESDNRDPVLELNMPPIQWQPMTPDSVYYASLEEIFEKPQDGYEVIEHWTGVEVESQPETGKQRRRYWLQVLARGLNDRKALLSVFGIPAPPEVNQAHIDDALSHLGWENYQWEQKQLGSAWIFKKFA